MEKPTFFGCVPEVKNSVVSPPISRVLGCQAGKATREVVTNVNHFTPNRGDRFHFGFFLLEKYDYPINLLQLSLELSKLPIQWLILRKPCQTAVEFADSRFFKRIEISQFECHRNKLRRMSRRINQLRHRSFN
jgi:hypothetical protein